MGGYRPRVALLGLAILLSVPSFVPAQGDAGDVVRLAAWGAPEEGRAVAFAASASGPAVAWSWEFGDGGTATGARPTHTYADAGAYLVRAVATFADGRTAAGTRTVTVANAACGLSWERTLGTPFEAPPKAAAAAGDVAFVAVPTGIGRLAGGQLTSLAAPADAYTSVAAASATLVLAGAADGSLALWNGASWSQPASPASRVNDVAAPTPTVLWAAGDAIYKSTNGAWLPSLLAPAGRSFLHLEAPSAATAYAADDAGGLWSFDGAWAPMTPSPGGAPRALSAPRDGELLVLDAAGAHRWSGGWLTLPPPPAGAAGIAEHDGAVVVAASAGLHRLVDGRWLPEPAPAGRLDSLAVGSSLFAFGPGRALKVTPSHVVAAALTATSLQRLAVAGGTASAAGAAGTLLLWDGAAWAPQPGPADELAAVALLEDGTGYAASANGLLRVDSAGYTPISSQPGIRDLVLLSPTSGWAVGDAGLLLRFDGTTWSAVTSPTTQRLNAVAFAGPTEGYAVGEAGTILRYAAGTWTKIASPVARALRDVAFAPDGAAHAVGDRLALRLAGATAGLVSTPGDQWRALTFAADGVGWVVGDVGRIATLSGSAWTIVASPTTGPLKDVVRVGGDVLAVGDQGTALRLRRVGCTQADFALPAETVEGTPLTFLDRSSVAAFDTVAARAWTFGDGTTSAARDPVKTYANQGFYNVRLSVTDDDGVTHQRSLFLRVLDAAPAAALAVPVSVVEGDALTLDASASAAGASTDALSRFEWDADDDGRFTPGASTLAWSFDDEGSRRVSVRVWDEDSSTTLSRVVSVIDHVPVADPGPSVHVDEGTIVRLDASASRDSPADRIVAWEWDLAPQGAFTADWTGAVVETTLPEGLHVVDLRVTDEDGASLPARLLVEVGNAAPIVRIVAPGPIAEGETATLTAEGTDPGGDALSFAWDLDGDGTWDTAPSPDPSITTVFPADGARAVRVLATDGFLAGTAELVLTILDSAPRADAGPDLEAVEGALVALDGRASSAHDGIVAWAWDVGDDGTVELAGAQAAWLAQEGDHLVRLLVTDGDGSVASDVLRILVGDAGPTAVIDLPEARVCACAEVTLDASASRSPVDAIVSFEWDRDFDGTFEPEATGPTVTIVATTDTTVAVRVTDADGSVSIATSNVLVVCFGELSAAGAESGEPGRWAEFTVVVRNPGGTPAEALIEATSNTSWTTQVTPESVTLAALEEATVHVRVLVPDDAVTGSSTQIDVTAHIAACLEITIGTNRTIIVNPRPARLDAAPDLVSLAVLPGGDYVVPIVLTNTGELRLDGIGGAVTSGPGWTASLSVPVTSLAGGASATAELRFSVPSPQGPGAFPFDLLFTSANGGSDDVLVEALLPNLPPVARAGPDRTVESDAAVALDGTASFDPNGDPLTYAWTQVSGPAVTLAGANGPTPTFTTPIRDSDAALVFRLTVADGFTSASDEVRIVALGRGSVAIVNPTPTRVIAPGQTVTFPFVVTNRERVTDTFRLEFIGLPPGWTAVAPTTVGPLAPGASATVPVTVQSPPLDQMPYGTGSGQQRALLMARATSVHWSDPRFAPLAAPTASTFGSINVPVLVTYSFSVQRHGLLGPELTVAQPVNGFDAVYPDPFEPVRFTVRATFVDGTPLAGGLMSGTIRWMTSGLPTAEFGVGRPMHTFSGFANADGVVSVAVPWTLLDLDPLRMNQPGTHRVTATAALYDHHGSKDARYLVDPANATRGLL